MFDQKTIQDLTDRASLATEARELTGTLVTTQGGTSLVFPAIGDLSRIEVPIKPQQAKRKVKANGDQS